MCVEEQPVMEGSMGVHAGTHKRVGYQVLAHLLGLGPERAECQDYWSRQGRSMQGLLYLKLLVGLGSVMNPGALSTYMMLSYYHCCPFY